MNFEKLPFRDFPKNRFMTMDQFTTYVERYLQHQHFKTMIGVYELLSYFSERSNLSDRDLDDIFRVLMNTECASMYERSEDNPMRMLPCFWYDTKNNKDIRELIDSWDNVSKIEPYDDSKKDKQYTKQIKTPEMGLALKDTTDTDYDVVKKPEHYNYSKIQPKDVIRAWGLNFNLGSAVKYIARAGHKDDIVQDLSKAIQFIHFELDYYKEYVLYNTDAETTNFSEMIIEYADHTMSDDEYSTTKVILEWDLIGDKECLGLAVNYIHMFHFVGGCEKLLINAIDNIQHHIDIIKKERNESNE